MNNGIEKYDVLIIGAGIGGLITSCQLSQAGKKVLLVENMSFLGGRFSAFKNGQTEISSGAFHTFPHGRNGPINQALLRSNVNVTIPPPDAFASFHVNGKHIIAKTGFGVFNTVSKFSDKLMLARGLFQARIQENFDGSYGDWLISLGATEEVRIVFDRFTQFALSTTIYDIPYTEARYVIAAIVKFGLPGVPVGGAREVAKQLGQSSLKSGTIIRKFTQLKQLVSQNGKVVEAVLYDRKAEQEYTIKTDLVISNASPEATIEMAKTANIQADEIDFKPPESAAIGLKVHVISPHSLIDHNSVMLCLDTQRVAGILQATNVDSKLAPEGKHLLISHQVTKPGADWREERDIALEDWKYMFGKQFDDCEVIGVSHFPERFPVNWATQGFDLRKQPFAENGLWMVGDGVKPPGLIMVEGVAASAEQVVSQILGTKYTPLKISTLDDLKQWLRRIQ